MTIKESTSSENRREQFYTERIRANQKKWPEIAACIEPFLHLLFTYNVVMERMARHLGEYRLSPSAFNILKILHSSPAGRPLHELGELLLVTKANVTGLVDSLESSGYVERVGDPLDRRLRVARLTEAGTKLLDQLLPGHHAELQACFAGLSQAEARELTRLLIQLRQSAEQIRDEESTV